MWQDHYYHLLNAHKSNTENTTFVDQHIKSKSNCLNCHSLCCYACCLGPLLYKLPSRTSTGKNPISVEHLIYSNLVVLFLLSIFLNLCIAYGSIPLQCCLDTVIAPIRNSQNVNLSDQ